MEEAGAGTVVADIRLEAVDIVEPTGAVVEEATRRTRSRAERRSSEMHVTAGFEHLGPIAPEAFVFITKCTSERLKDCLL